MSDLDAPNQSTHTSSAAPTQRRYDLNAFPYNVAAWPTEPLLKATRSFIPPVAGVDITPIVWVAVISFFSEILLGPQGLLTIIQRKGGF